MIQSIEMKFFRGIREGRLEGLTPLTVLVGPNGSGKSTVLEAIWIAASPDPVYVQVAKLATRRTGWQGARWLFWKGNNENTAEITVRSGIGTTRQYRLSLIGQDTRFRIRCQFQSSPDAKPAYSFVNLDAAGKVGEKGTEGPEPDPGPLKGISELRFLSPAHEDGQRPLHQLYTRARELGRLQEVTALLKELIPTLEDIEILAPADHPTLYLVYPDRSIPVTLVGDGVRLLVRYSLELATQPQGVVLLEEPEVHMHPGAIWRAAQVIVAAMRRDVQVILTTHSLELIDALIDACSEEDLVKMSLFNVRLDDGTLISSQLTGPEVHLARSTIKDDLR